MLRHAVLVLFRHWDIDGRVNVLKQWNICRSRCLPNLKHLSLPYCWNVCSVLFEILLDCGRDLLLVAAVFACRADQAERMRRDVLDL